MKGKVYMNPKIIKVALTVISDVDVLIFRLDEENPEGYIVDLNSSSSQSSLKHIFSKLLNILIDEDVKLELEIDKDYKKGLYKDVCMEYIADLNQELTQVKESMLKELS